MGVTVHHYAFDPACHPVLPSIEFWAERGDIGEDLSVSEQAKGFLQEVPSLLGNNKIWYRNLDASYAWSLTSKKIDPSVLEHMDHWFSHLFYTDHTPDCGLATKPSSDSHGVLFDASLIAHVCALEVSLGEVTAVLRTLGQSDLRFQESKRVASYPEMYEPEGFEWLVGMWMDMLNRVRRKHPGWSLLQWVWF